MLCIDPVLMIRPQPRSFMPGKTALVVWNALLHDNVHDRVPFIFRELVNRCHMLNARIIDENIDFTQLHRRNRSAICPDLFRLGHIGVAI